VFEYFGEGQVGDMVLQRGNLAIGSHAAEGKSLLLFRKTAMARYISPARSNCSREGAARSDGVRDDQVDGAPVSRPIVVCDTPNVRAMSTSGSPASRRAMASRH
jgi:hypothetical protein